MTDRVAGNKIVYSAQETIAETGAVGQALSRAVGERWLFQADFSNAGSVWVGLTNACFLELKPGDTLEWDVDDISTVFFRSQNGTEKVNVMGRL